MEVSRVNRLTLPHGAARKVRALRSHDARDLDLLERSALANPDAARWMVPPVEWEQARGTPMFDVKHRWVESVEQEWGSVSQVVEQEARSVALALVCVPSQAPGVASLPTAPVSEDAALLLELWVEPGYRGGGLAKVLVQAVARELVLGERVQALESFGDANALAERGLARVSLLESLGFAVHREHPSTPRMRMDLRATRSWTAGLEEAWDRIASVVRPGNAEPAAGGPAAGRNEADPVEPVAPVAWLR